MASKSTKTVKIEEAKEAPEMKASNVVEPEKEAVKEADVTEEKKETKSKGTITKKATEKKTTAKKTATKKTTKATEEKKETKKKTTTKKVDKTVVFEFHGVQTSIDVEAYEEKVKEIWLNDWKRTAKDLKTIDLYIKPEDGKVYFVINGAEHGAIDL